jgi:hypothetical protein
MNARVARIAGLLLGIAFMPRPAASEILTGPFSDQFSGTTLNPGWTVSSPNPASSVGLTGNGFLQILASPLNGGSDLCACSNYNAPVILQPISSSLDWSVNVQLDFEPTHDAQGAGIMLATQNGQFTESSQFLRVIEHDYVSSEIVCAFGVPTEGATCGGYVGGTIYFRVTKSGSTYTAEYSPDKKQWTKLAKQTISTSYSYIGLYGARQPWDGNDGIVTIADFNYFDIKVKSKGKALQRLEI